MKQNGIALWLRWVMANSAAELVGLGATFAIGFGLFSGPAESAAAGPAILSALLMTASGAIEGGVVGAAQWWAMRPAFPGMPRRLWVTATIIGAVLAWFLGSIPMTLASLSNAGQQGAAPEPEGAAFLIMTAAMGLAAGLVLALAQWRALRRIAGRAWLWLPANALAWGVGMPLIFVGVDLAQKGGTLAGGVAIMAAALAAAGAAVGAVHGLALVKLAGQTT